MWCCVMSCCVVLCRVVSCSVVWCVWCCVVSCCVVSCGVVSCGVVSCGVVQCRVVSCGVVRCCAVLTVCVVSSRRSAPTHAGSSRLPWTAPSEPGTFPPPSESHILPRTPSKAAVRKPCPAALFRVGPPLPCQNQQNLR